MGDNSKDCRLYQREHKLLIRQSGPSGRHMSDNKKVNFVAECDECGHTLVSEDFDWECYTHHMEDYEDRYAAALGIKYNGDGTW